MKLLMGHPRQKPLLLHLLHHAQPSRFLLKSECELFGILIDYLRNIARGVCFFCCFVFSGKNKNTLCEYKNITVYDM